MPDVVGTTNYPTSLDTAVSLIESNNNAVTALDGGIDDSETTITVISTGAFPDSGVISIDNEIVSYTGKTSTTFTGCIRGFDDSTPATHADEASVEGRLVSKHMKVLQDAIIATQTKLNSTASGAVSGPGSSTDNAVARFDSTTGKVIQNSPTTVNDAGAITMPEMTAPSTPASGHVVIYPKSDGKVYSKDDTGSESVLGGEGAQLNVSNTWTAQQTFNSNLLARTLLFSAPLTRNISANQNGLSLESNNASWLRISSSSVYEIRGIEFTVSTYGWFVFVSNVGGNTFTIKNESASATSERGRIITPGGTDFSLLSGMTIIMIYDGQSERWRIIST